MNKDNTSYIIADAHLGAKESALEGLQSWVASLDAATTEIIFLGDLFHIWAGPAKYHSEDVTLFLKELQLFRERGGRCSLIVGNRDVFFKGGKGYPMQHLPFEEIALDFLTRRIGGKTLVCTHGDMVNSQDHQYLRWRKIVRSKLFRFAFSLIPAAKVKSIMLGIENKLKTTNQAFRIAFPVEEWETYIKNTQQKQAFDLLVVGHFHPEKAISTKVGQATAMVIPDWYAAGVALKIDLNLDYEFITTH